MFLRFLYLVSQCPNVSDGLTSRYGGESVEEVIKVVAFLKILYQVSNRNSCSFEYCSAAHDFWVAANHITNITFHGRLPLIPEPAQVVIESIGFCKMRFKSGSFPI